MLSYGLSRAWKDISGVFPCIHFSSSFKDTDQIPKGFILIKSSIEGSVSKYNHIWVLGRQNSAHK
jgi:hypothetical protein